jgi:hypothetical protein
MSSILLPYMLRPGEQAHVTENYVSSPPALLITDEAGDVWTLGTGKMPDAPRGEFAFDVLKNGMPTGESASRIERRAGRIRIFTPDGWKRWTGVGFV